MGQMRAYLSIKSVIGSDYFQETHSAIKARILSEMRPSERMQMTDKVIEMYAPSWAPSRVWIQNAVNSSTVMGRNMSTRAFLIN